LNASDAIRLIALRDVYYARVGLADEHDYNLRRIFRWYSHHFHTPLHEVESLPITDVVRAYWEQRYENLDDEFLEDAVRQAAMTDEDLAAADRDDDEKDVDAYHARRKENEAKAGRLRKEIELRQKAAADMMAGRRPPPRKPKKDRDAELVANPDLVKLGNKMPPNISLTFVNDDEEIDLEQDSMGLGIMKPSTAKKK
jgi:hypothetical protein